MSDRDGDLDPQADALLDRLTEGITPPSATLSVERMRTELDALLTDENPETVGETQHTELQGPGGALPIKIYAPEGEGPFPVLVYCHGGGWVRGSLEGYDGLCRRITNRASCLVVSVGYRRAPEHPFPAAFEDCYHVTEWAAENARELGGDPDRIAVGGDSAGGNLAAAVTLAARDRDGPALSHQLLLYPTVNPPTVTWFDSYDSNGEGYLLEMDSVQWYLDQYCDEADVGNQYAFPIRARSLADVPPATVVTAGFDPLADEGEAYVERLESAGVDVTHFRYDDQIHAFVSLYEYLDAGAEAIEEVSASLREAFEE